MTGVQHTNKTDGSSCDDGNACMTNDVCSGGQCVGGATGTFGPATNFETGAYSHDVANGDLNGDGKPDLAAANYTGGNVSILLGIPSVLDCDDHNPCTVDSCDPASGRPAGVVFPFGFFSWTVTGLGPGQSILLVFTYPAPVPVGARYWKVVGGVWTDLTSQVGSNDGDNTLTLTVTDGGAGDADGLMNGQISDPGGIAVPSCTDASVCDDGDACTTDVCAVNGGLCFHAPVLCVPSDSCHVAGMCDTVTGACSNPQAADGAACDDGLACTTADACASGICAGVPVPPPSVINDAVRVDKSPANSTITWNDPPGLYNVYRGLKAAGVAWTYNQTCLVTGVAGSSAADGDDPPPNQFFYYLLSRVDACSAGSLGTNSAGGERPNNAPCAALAASP